MYMFGQADGSGAAETLHSVADVTRAVTEPATEAYKAHLRADVQRERIKAGLAPSFIVAPPQQQPQPRWFQNPLAIVACAVVLYAILN